MGIRRNVPVASLIGALMQSIGIAIFCNSAILGVNQTLRLFVSNQTVYGIAEREYVYFIEVGVYTSTAFTMIWAVGFLFIAFLTHKDGNLRCSSLGCVGATIFFNYVVLILWVAFLCAASVLLTFSMLLSGHRGIDSTTPTPVDFTYYGLKIDEVLQVENLIGISGNMVLFFSLTVGGAALVTFGLVNSIACMASNWKHLKGGDQWKDYAQKRKQEERELHEMTSYKSSERLAASLYY